MGPIPLMKNIPKILVTPGEPSSIGYDISLDIPKNNFDANLVIIASLEILEERANLLERKINFIEVDINDDVFPKLKKNDILVHDINNTFKVKIGSPNVKHVPIILESLDIAIKACLEKKADAIVTGPVQKSTIMKYGKDFSGHTEYIASKTGNEPIMMLHTKNLKIALLTTHLPLADVPKLVTKKRLESYVKVISKELNDKFGIDNPKISVCGLNPHAGEDGYIGYEEKDIIMPTIKHLQIKGYNVEGPFSADTIFTRDNQDLILAMFHDQALPVIKTLGFGNIVNTTLGLPIIRTSVDHGTALDIAGTNKANSDSLIEAIKTSINIVNQENDRKN